MAAANHGERIGGGKISSARKLGDGFLASVDKVGVNFLFKRIRADTEHPVFRLQDDVHSLGDETGDERGHADPEIDVVAVAQLERDAAGDPFAFLVFSQRHRKLNEISFPAQAMFRPGLRRQWPGSWRQFCRLCLGLCASTGWKSR